jgi:hypothetical protein
VVLTDTLPVKVSYVSHTADTGSSGAPGVYNAGPPEMVTWNIGTLPANDPGGCVTITVTVNTGVAPGTIITNSVRITGDETGSTTVTKQTKVCENGGPIPSMTGWGIIAMVVVLSGLGVLMLRRRQAY